MTDDCTIFSYWPFSFQSAHRAQAELRASGRRLFRWLGSLLVGAAASLVGGCAYVDNIAPRADTINRSITDYRNEATFLNIIRASYSEPMDFVTVTGATGHSTFNGSQGLPTFIIGPHTAPTASNPVAARNYVFGPNSIQESAGTDFNVALLDDPQSYVALMTPIDAGMIAFFQRTGTPTPVLLPLFISEIRIINKSDNKVYAFSTDQPQDGGTFIFCHDPKGIGCEPEIHCLKVDAYRCEAARKSPSAARASSPDTAEDVQAMLHQCQAGQARCVPPAMLATAYLTARGIRFQVPIGTVPGQQQTKQVMARICFDRLYQISSLNEKSGETFDSYLALLMKDRGEKEDEAKRREIMKRIKDQYEYYADNSLTVQGDAFSAFRPAKFVAHFRCDDNDTPWIPLGVADSAQQQSGGRNADPALPSNLCINGACSASRTGRSTANNRSAKAENADRAPTYVFYDGSSVIEVFTRSTWGIYQFLGNLMQRQELDGTVDILGGGIHDDQSLFRVRRGNQGNCFVSLAYSGETYCIPQDAFNSKRIISVLHELANLYTKPNNTQQPNTGTARITQ